MFETPIDPSAPRLPLKNRAALAAAKAAVEGSDSAMIVTDPRLPDNPIVLANESFCRLTGYSEAEILGRNCRFLQGSETHPQAVEALRAAVSAGRPGVTTLTNYRKDGRPFLNCVQILPIRDEGGELILFIGSQFEVTPLETIFPISAGWTFEE